MWENESALQRNSKEVVASLTVSNFLRDQEPIHAPPLQIPKGCNDYFALRTVGLQASTSNELGQAMLKSPLNIVREFVAHARFSRRYAPVSQSQASELFRMMLSS